MEMRSSCRIGLASINCTTVGRTSQKAHIWSLTLAAWESTRIRPAAIWANCTSDCVRPISAIGTCPVLHLQSYQFSKSLVNRQTGWGCDDVSPRPQGPGLRRNRPPVRVRVPRVAPLASGLAGWSTRRLGRTLAATDRRPPDRPFLRLTLAKLRYYSTRRRQSPGSTYGFLAATLERTTHASDIARADLSPSFHGTTHSASTWRKTPRVITGMPSSSRPSTRRSFQQRRPLSRFSGKLYRVPDGGCVSTGLLPSCGRDQIALKCPL